VDLLASDDVGVTGIGGGGFGAHGGIISRPEIRLVGSVLTGWGDAWHQLIVRKL